jgi:hypothetical protein
MFTAAYCNPCWLERMVLASTVLQNCCNKDRGLVNAPE